MAHFTTWGMSGTVATQNPLNESEGLDRVAHWIELFDQSCNRFRVDSEISRINQSSGGTFDVSETLLRALLNAAAADELSEGLCDPTVLNALEALGYDRDYDEIAALDRPEPLASRPAPGRSSWSIDVGTKQLTLAPGTKLDLGATAKAMFVDVVLEELSTFGGALVELGGDVALHGPGPEGPWVVGLATSLTVHGSEPRVALDDGGIATSSAITRVWRSGGQLMNHIIDPRTGRSAEGLYAVATVAGPNCVTANALATAALLWDDEAGYHIAQAGCSARLVRHNGELEFVGGWPNDSEAA